MTNPSPELERRLIAAFARGLFRFGHTYTVHSCARCKDYKHTSPGDVRWSRFYLVLAIVMAAPLAFYLWAGPLKMPWYDVFGVVAGEMLLFYAAAFAVELLTMFQSTPKRKCPACGGAVGMNGRYFVNGERADFQDYVLITVCVAVNVALWVFILRGGLCA